MIRRVFFDDELEKVISVKGYACIKKFVSGEICDSLSLFFEQNDSIDARPFTISNWNNDSDHRSKIFRKIIKILSPAADIFLDNYKPVMGVYAAKRAGGKSDMRLHQDWTLVDEAKFRSVSIWVALCDMNLWNGNLQVAERSHIYAAFPRGMNVPVPFENIRGEIEQKFLTNIEMKKGDAVVFDHRLIHASPENNSDKIRLAAVMALIPTEADLLHYYKHEQKNGELEILKMQAEDFHTVDFFDIPNKPRHISGLGVMCAWFRQIELEEVEQLLNE
jgi:ectoine hydroxylase-related dioxygenase (phytanoyl-CoA dioxygenase family)